MSEVEQLNQRLEHELTARKEAERSLKVKSLELEKALSDKRTTHLKLNEEVAARNLVMARLQLEVSRREQTEFDMAGARNQALDAYRLKSEFLANMSHEIRTPLNAVIGLTNLLLHSDLDGEQRDFLETIHLSGDSLLTLLNDILDFSRIEANALELEQQPFKIRDCVENAIDSVSERANTKEIDLSYQFKSRMPEIFVGDAARIQQILINLLGNAVKFTNAGEITVTVQLISESITSSCLQIEVSDTGIGIPAERMQALFDSFGQIDSSTKSKYGGAGLGLAISKRLCEMMGGQMWVKSKLGKGSTFIFSLNLLPTETKHTAPLQLPQSELRDKRVLIVDDNETNRLILCRQVEAWGMFASGVASATEALARLKIDNQFDVALLDMRMPDMNGVMLAQEIKRQFPQVDFPIILLSSAGQRPASATSKLFDAYANKPVKPAALRRILTKLINRRNQAFEPIERVKLDIDLGSQFPLRILIAEDNIVNQKVARRMLRKMGYEADVTPNGLKAVQALKLQRYDVILMDVMMPEMNGLEATRQIISNWPPETRPYIIALTANALKGDREQFLKAGMDNYLSKPVRFSALASILREFAISRAEKRVAF